MPKCDHCKKYKKAEFCQECFLKLQSDFCIFLNEIEELTKIIHISSLDKIRENIKQKREQIRNGVQ